MAPIDGAICLKLEICNAYTSDVNIFKAQPSKVSGLGGVALQRSKSAPILYKYKLTAPGQRTRMLRFHAIWLFLKEINSFLFNFHCEPQSLKESTGYLGSATNIPGMNLAY